MQALEEEKKNKELRIRQLEVTFRSKHISLPVETVEAAQTYLRIVSKENPRYNPAEDRAKLEHWLNVSRHRWADRLEALYPSLTNNEKTFVSYLCWGLVLMILPIYLGFKPVLSTVWFIVYAENGVGTRQQGRICGANQPDG